MENQPIGTDLVVGGDKPEMAVISRRPVKLLKHLQSSEGVLVSCRLATGEDTFIPLKEIFALFEREIVQQLHLQGGH